MYNELINYCKNYEPLKQDEQDLLVSESIDDEELLTTLIRHNARIIIKEINKWLRTYNDPDDIAMIAMQGCMLAFEKWDRKWLFGCHCRLYISAKLHRQWQRYQSIADYDITDLEIADDHVEDYSDLRDVINDIMQKHLTVDEATFIQNIYFNNMSVDEAGKLYGYTAAPSKSRKKTEILAKLREHLPADLALLYINEEI